MKGNGYNFYTATKETLYMFCVNQQFYGGKRLKTPTYHHFLSH